MLREVGVLDDNFLERSNYNYEAISIKILHLTQENSNLRQYLSDLQKQLHSLRLINQQLLKKSPEHVQTILKELIQLNGSLQQSIHAIIKKNQELSSDVLMKSQIITQNQNQFRQILSDYQNKIYQLRTNLQAKQGLIASIQNKKLAEKGDILNPPTRSNVMWFNEINQLRFLNERYNIQNITLQLLVTSKNQSLQQTKRKLKKCEQYLKRGQSWAAYNTKGQNTTELQKTKQKSTIKLKLEQQLLRYDNKYKHITSQYNPNSNDIAAQILNLKQLVCQLYNHTRKLEEEKHKLQKSLSNKDRDLNEIKLGYRQLEIQMKQQRVQVEFYRQNFKELSKVTTQQKIKYYNDYYKYDIPLVKQNFFSLQELVAKWKEQQKSSSLQRRMLSKLIKKPQLKSDKRSLSCIPKFNILDQNVRQTCPDLKMQNSILSFINETHELPSLIQCQADQKLQNVKTNEQQKISFGEISEIQKVIKSIKRFNRKEHKQVFLKEEL